MHVLSDFIWIPLAFWIDVYDWSDGGDLGRNEKNKMTACLFSVESCWRLTDTVTHTCYTLSAISLHRKTCLIFLSSRANIWHKEALDSGRTIQGWHRMGRGHERGPSWIQLAPLGSSFKQPVLSSTHAHALLEYVHASDAQTCTFTRNALLWKACVKCLVWRHVPHNVGQLVVYCKNSGIQPNESFNAV